MQRCWALLAITLLVCTGGTLAEEATEAAGDKAEASAAPAQQVFRHPLTAPPPALPGVETAFWFPNHPQMQFPAGAPIDVVVGFHNGASEEVNVSAIMGSINSPASFDIFVQNFTYQQYDVALAPGEEASLLYTFRTDPALHPREFQVALTVFYQTLTAPHTTHFFNKTVDVVEKARFLDTELVGLWSIVAALAAGAAYLLWGYLSSFAFVRKATSKRSSRSKPVEVRKEGDVNQWLQGTHYSASAKQSTQKVSKKTS